MNSKEAQTTPDTAIIEHIIQKVFATQLDTLENIEKKFPSRSSTGPVTRFPPSPTGFMHIGNLYSALISERYAHVNNGLFYLRIEDTDSKRKVEGATDLIIQSLKAYNITPDEGVRHDTHQKIIEFGDYGPYFQSERKHIYDAYCAHLLRIGKAYICFATQEELEKMRTTQELQKIRPGYYGSWALYRNTSLEEVLEKLEAGIPYVIRFKSQGNFDTKIEVDDILRGKLFLSENDQDVVIRKSDGLPTYHFAHAIDDHLMHTTHVIRGDEWLASLTLHLELFSALGFQPPRYGHIMPIQKIDGTKRKLSKRKDPEANLQFYSEKGYPETSIIEYLLNLANSSFENWRNDNPTLPYSDFPFSLELVSHSTGPLFDLVKLSHISKEIIARMSAEEVYTHTVTWAEKFSPKFADILKRDSEYTQKILGIERTGEKIRKDIAAWSEVESYISYFFDDIFNEIYAPKISEALKNLPNVDTAIISQALQGLNKIHTDTNSLTSPENWLEQVRNLVKELGYAETTKAYKQNPENYKGTIAHITSIFRLALTGMTQTPDLYQVISVLGKDRVQERIERALALVK